MTDEIDILPLGFE